MSLREPFLSLSVQILACNYDEVSGAFRTGFTPVVAVKATWGSAFGAASLITPFLLGTCKAITSSPNSPCGSGVNPCHRFMPTFDDAKPVTEADQNSLVHPC